MEIKLANEHNLIEVSYIFRECSQQFIESGFQCWEFAHSSYEDIANDISKKYVYLAFIKKVPVGTISLRPDSSDTSIINIDRLAIFPHYQRRGFAKTLIDFAIVEATKKGAKTIRGIIPSHNKMLVKLLDEKGFINVREVDKMFNEGKGTIFEKTLRKH
ncbi:MAG TPA: GNAT family N-acetyltransferase [Tenuifilaceae bacterium]|nr:GNAT family N-acetyltransferase [Tenuifilaceae bacterium]